MRLSRPNGSSHYVAILVLVILLFASYTHATSIQGDENIHISNLHEIDDDLYAFGENVTVDGLIKGDLVAGAYEVFANGEVTESENVFAYKLHHTGTVGNSLRAFANTVVIDGRVGRSIILFAYDSHIGKGAVVERDVSIAGYSSRVEGVIKGNANIYGNRIFISGEIGGDVDLGGDEITISPPAVIRGNLTYTCEKEVEIDTAAGVTILGETRWERPEEKRSEDEKETGLTAFRTMIFKISKILAAFLFGIIVVYLFRRYAEVSFHQLRTRFAVSIATGFLFLLILVVAILILVISAIFLLVGLVLISGEMAPVGALVLILSMLMVPITAFTTVSGGIIFYSGKIMFAFLVGYLLVRIFKSQAALLGKAQLLFGLIVLTLAFAVPYVGILVHLLVGIAGAGAIVLGIKNCRAVEDRPKGGNSVMASHD
jgi:cytoskeletal protein CcmA (bactofilin family)